MTRNRALLLGIAATLMATFLWHGPVGAGERLARHVRGETLGGTGLSNPMKSFAQIEALLLKATPVEGGYLVNGTLPWVSNLAPDHYFGAIAAVQVDGASAGREGPQTLAGQRAGIRDWRCTRRRSGVCRAAPA